MASLSNQERLRAYEIYLPSDASLAQRTFGIVLALTLLAFLALGMYLKTITPLEEEFFEQVTRLRAQFVMPEERRPQEPPKPKPPAAKPVDLTKSPLLAQKEDVQAEKPPQEAPRARPVYGLRRVFSTGLGSGGAMSDAVIGKLGNTINKDVDTVTATLHDLKGQVVSVTTITTAPTVRKVVKPEYTKEMLDNKVEGVVKVKVLVDVDGRVKKAIALNDLGFGAADGAVKACYQMEFAPAMRGTEAVAVWIIIPIRFVIIG